MGYDIIHDVIADLVPLRRALRSRSETFFVVNLCELTPRMPAVVLLW